MFEDTRLLAEVLFSCIGDLADLHVTDSDEIEISASRRADAAQVQRS
jgi:hypothetical protein